MKKVSFEINSEYRMLENSELVSLLIGNDCVCENCEEYNSGKDIRFVLARMTPAKQKIAMAAIELLREICQVMNRRNQSDVAKIYLI